MKYIILKSNKANNKVFEIKIRKDDYYRKTNNRCYNTYYKGKLVDFGNYYKTKKVTYEIASIKLDFIN